MRRSSTFFPAHGIFLRGLQSWVPHSTYLSLLLLFQLFYFLYCTFAAVIASANKNSWLQVEQNHSRLVEQAGALQGLDAARQVICSEMDQLYDNAEKLSSRFLSIYEELEALGRSLERLYSVNRIVAGLNRLVGIIPMISPKIARRSTLQRVFVIVVVF